MKILIIILSIIGLLKLVSLFILVLLQIYHFIKGNKVIEAHRDSCFYIENNFYILPTIVISHTTKYVEVTVHWLCIEYYEATCFEFEKDKE
jgi:hypothetical protein